MSRLFLRFYAGVLIILFTAWYVQSWVFQYSSGEQNARVVVEAMSGGVRVARDWLNLAPGTEQTVLPKVQERFDFPVRVVDIDSGRIPERAKPELRKHDLIVLFGGNEAPSADVEAGPYVATRLREGGRVLCLGPLPQFVGPEQTAQLTGLGTILLFAAVAIAVLLRPVVRQLREVEKTATAIADGDLDARIALNRVPRGRSLALAFNSMADRTQSLLRTQRELLQAVSHDLRTPLAKMRFAIGLVGSAKTDEDREARLESLDAATEELDSLVGELLNYVRMETADHVTNIELLPVEELVRAVVDIHRDMHPNLEFKVDVSPNARINADHAGVHRVLANLIGNACRFARRTIRIGCTASEGRFALMVDDDGPGIPDVDRERVFNPFVRLPSNADSGRGSGVGLGLALVSRILQRHGGSVAIADSDLGGCRIRTEWPLNPT